MVLFGTACQQDKHTAKAMEQHNQMQMTAMMDDSSMVNTMMDGIAANGRMRMMMMQKMIHHTQADSAGMKQMCQSMMDDKEMHAMMMKMMGGGTAMDGTTMKHDMVQNR
jgi:hypothetical protein